MTNRITIVDAMFSLSASDWAAWVQAVGSIVAILVSSLMATTIAKRQSASDRRLDQEQRHRDKVDQVETLHKIASNCSKVVRKTVEVLGSRESIYFVAEGDLYIDLNGVRYFEAAITSIPLHGLPREAVTHVMILSGAVRQFRERVEKVIKQHTSMDANAFTALFEDFSATQESIDRQVDKLAELKLWLNGGLSHYDE